MNAIPILVLSLSLVSGCAAPEARGPAPGFDLVDVDGVPVRLAEWRGTPILLELFGTHCGSCRAMMGQLLPYYTEFGQPARVRMLSVDLGERFDGLGAKNEDEIRAWRTEFGANWTFAADDANHTVAGLYAVIARPTFYLIDAEGRIAWERGGYTPLSELRSQSEKVLS